MRSNSRSIFLAFIFIVIVGSINFYYSSIIEKASESYAAWDTGTLLVAYLEKHRRWPNSWSDLVGLLNSEVGLNISLRGVRDTTRIRYVSSLQKTVAIDWEFDLLNSESGNPVTKLEGGLLRSLWSDPNEMIRQKIDCIMSDSSPSTGVMPIPK